MFLANQFYLFVQHIQRLWNREIVKPGTREISLRLPALVSAVACLHDSILFRLGLSFLHQQFHLLLAIHIDSHLRVAVHPVKHPPLVFYQRIGKPLLIRRIVRSLPFRCSRYAVRVCIQYGVLFRFHVCRFHKRNIYEMYSASHNAFSHQG